LVFGAVAGPIQFEAALGAWDVGVVETHVDVLCDLVVWEFNKAISDRSVFHFVSDELDLGDASDALE
jgi:hypothetical protein